jgi:Rrf2 family transcriptional regulator, cysteine metabolism repressor
LLTDGGLSVSSPIFSVRSTIRVMRAPRSRVRPGPVAHLGHAEHAQPRSASRSDDRLVRPPYLRCQANSDRVGRITAVIFTTKAEYGVRLLIQLGLQGGGAPVSLKAVADAENLPLAYLERIAALLKKAGLVQATRGAHGGYVLARPAEEITMDEAVLALEGAIAPMDCFVDDREARVLCSHLFDGEHCATKLLWTRVQMGVIKSLQRTTLAELVDFAAPTEKTLEIHG